MKNKTGNDLTVGSIPAHILKFAVPMLAGLFLTMGYSIINTIWIGNLLGKEAMGAAAVSFPITFILISVASGSTTATSILVSQHFGSRNIKMLEKVIENSWCIFPINAALLTVLAITFRKSLLVIMGTPNELFNMASGYLSISLFGFFITYMYYVINSIFSGIGDSKTPLIFLVASTGVNAILDPIFISKLGLNGAALATLASGIAAVIAALISLKKRNFEIPLIPKKIKFEKVISLQILKLALPSVVQQCLMPISLIFITSFINRFGSDAIAAYGAAKQIDYLAVMPAMAMGTAASVITGQNIGAGKLDRVREVFRYGSIMNLIFLSVIAVLVMIFPRQILLIFVRDNNVLSIGSGYLKVNAIGYCVFGLTYITNGIINGSGKTIITMIISTISLIALRVPLAGLLSKTHLGLNGIWYAMLFTYGVSAICSMTYYKSRIIITENVTQLKLKVSGEVE